MTYVNLLLVLGRTADVHLMVLSPLPPLLDSIVSGTVFIQLA